MHGRSRRPLSERLFGPKIMLENRKDTMVSRPLVLVVDDDPAIRDSLRFSLEIEGFRVRAYAGGAELLNDRGVDGGDCLVVDQNMPGMNGLDLLRHLRASHVVIPAILITSHPAAALSERAAKAGVAIVEKPFLGTELVDRIRDLSTRTSAAIN
jgi:FixJ family two-component response regulator